MVAKTLIEFRSILSFFTEPSPSAKKLVFKGPAIFFAKISSTMVKKLDIKILLKKSNMQ